MALMELDRLDRTEEKSFGQPLSAQQLRVVELMVRGMTAKEAAVRMGVSRRTVETFRAQAALKLGARNVHDLVRIAVASGTVMVSDVDPYEVLGVQRDATAGEVAAAHRRAVKRTHPDAGGDREEFHQVTLAADVLRDPGRRAKYDETGDLGGEPDVTRSAALGILVEIIDNLVGQWVGAPPGMARDPSEGRLLEEIGHKLRRRAAELKDPMDQLTRGAESLGRMGRRLRIQGTGESSLAAAVHSHREHILAQRRQLEQKLAAVMMAQAMLSEHSYEGGVSHPLDIVGIQWR